MALIFFDSFGYASAASHSDATAGDDLHMNWAGGYSSVVITELEATSEGRRCYASHASTGTSLHPEVTFSLDTFYVGFRFYRSSHNSTKIIKLLNSGSDIGALGIDALGRIAYSVNGTLDINSNQVLTSDYFIPLNTWVYIEVKFTLDGSTGALEFRVDGNTVGSVSGVDTENGAGPCNALRFMPSEALGTDWHSSGRLADIYIDDAGFQGPVEVWYQAADSAGSTANFTPLASTNQSQVDDIGNDGDTTYNSSSSTGNYDRLTTSKSLSAAPKALQTLILAKEVSAEENARAGVRSDVAGTPTESLGPVTALTTNYDVVRGNIEETDPDTASAWTAANADAAEIVYYHSA